MSAESGFLDPDDFPFVAVLERKADLVKKELDRVLVGDWFQSFRHRPNGRDIVYEPGWDVFGFFQRGKEYTRNTAVCPRTSELIELVPDIITAGFSRLAGGARISPHAGKRDLVRCHLGLIVPPRCWFRVGNEVRQWEVNKCLLFDNTVEHEAWNDSNKDRIVFVVDFVNHLGGREQKAAGKRE